MRQPALSNRDDFDHWVSYMPDGLKHFFDGLPDQIRNKLDYSPASLDALEKWILETYPSTEAMLKPDQASRVGGAARYIGETFRKAIGGHWDIRFDDPNNAFFAIPILTGFNEHPAPTPVSPLALTTTAADRRTGKFLRTILENKLKRIVK